MNEQYQKVAYIGLRKKDGSYAVNIPLYVKLDEVDKKGNGRVQRRNYP